jgi:hypothetical protein
LWGACQQFKYFFSFYSSFEFQILLNVIAHTNNRLLRAINLLTAARITRDGIHKVPFTNDDSEAEIMAILSAKNISYYIFRFNIISSLLRVSKIQKSRSIWTEARTPIKRILCYWSTCLFFFWFSKLLSNVYIDNYFVFEHQLPQKNKLSLLQLISHI